MSPSPARRYAKLLEEVRRHDRLYYVEARPEISDAAYDRLYRELQDIEKAHPDLVDENSPTKKVGGAPLDSFRTLRRHYRDWETDRKSTRLNSSHLKLSRMPSSA